MNKPAAILPRLFFVMALGLTLSACTVTDPSSSSRSTGGDGSSSLTSDGLLKEDMALGQGEYLASLAALMGVEKARQTEFFAFTKEKFPSVFSSDQITSTEMLATLNRELLADPRFNKLVAHN
jgi:hypothetical protein